MTLRAYPHHLSKLIMMMMMMMIKSRYYNDSFLLKFLFFVGFS